jgi:hypothetical protein
VAVLLNKCTKETRRLQSHTLVGRAQPCGLRLDEALVSSEHASLSWQEGAWYVRDLGSRNGTYLNGARLTTGISYPCPEGAVLAFGDQRQEWQLTDASEPVAMVLPLNGAGAPCLLVRGMIAFPEAERPLASIHQGAGGAWLLEVDERVEELVDGSVIQLPGSNWRFHCPHMWHATESPGQRPFVLEATQLCFRVSRDEESVELDLRCHGQTISLGSRSPFYMLLTLARLRLAQRESPSPGWIHWSELAEELQTEQSEINLWVHRIRERFAEAGVVRPGAIIERRSRAGHLRIGIENILITQM